LESPRAPPTTTHEIFNPAHYGTPPSPTAVIGFEDAFGPLGVQDWDKGDDAIGELDLRKVLLGAPAEQVILAVDGLTNGMSLTATKEHRKVSLTGYVSSSESAANTL
jgi:hypothetical protein